MLKCDIGCELNLRLLRQSCVVASEVRVVVFCKLDQLLRGLEVPHGVCKYDWEVLQLLFQRRLLTIDEEHYHVFAVFVH